MDRLPPSPRTQPRQRRTGSSVTLALALVASSRRDPGTGGRGRAGTFTRHNNAVLELTLEGQAEPLHPTANHPLFSATRNAWVRAAQLRPGEELRTADDKVRIVSIGTLPGEHRVFNLEVEYDHHYFVGSRQFLVHNACFPTPPVPPAVFAKHPLPWTVGTGQPIGGSKDALTNQIASMIETAKPGHVVGLEVPVTDANGKLVTDIDLLLKNAGLQIKKGIHAGGIELQVSIAEHALQLPGIGYGPKFSPATLYGVSQKGALITNDQAVLLDVIKQ